MAKQKKYKPLKGDFPRIDSIPGCRDFLDYVQIKKTGCLPIAIVFGLYLLISVFSYILIGTSILDMDIDTFVFAAFVSLILAIGLVLILSWVLNLKKRKDLYTDVENTGLYQNIDIRYWVKEFNEAQPVFGVARLSVNHFFLPEGRILDNKFIKEASFTRHFTNGAYQGTTCDIIYPGNSASFRIVNKKSEITDRNKEDMVMLNKLIAYHKVTAEQRKQAPSYPNYY